MTEDRERIMAILHTKDDLERNKRHFPLIQLDNMWLSAYRPRSAIVDHAPSRKELDVVHIYKESIDTRYNHTVQTRLINRVQVHAYNSSLRLCFLVALVFACLSVIGSLSIEWRNVKEEADGVSKNPASDNAAGDGKNLGALSSNSDVLLLCTYPMRHGLD
jgi:hypothetical protein